MLKTFSVMLERDDGRGRRGSTTVRLTNWVAGLLIKGLFGTAPPTPDWSKTAQLYKKFAKRSTSTKFRSTKILDLRARFTKMLELLKGCSPKLEWVELRKLPTTSTSYVKDNGSLYFFIFSSSDDQHKWNINNVYTQGWASRRNIALWITSEDHIKLRTLISLQTPHP